MTLQQLSYIAAVAKYGSFSKAAQSLYVSQPCISRMVQSLEEELGIPIFVRTSSGITLTEKGRELLNMGNRLLQDAERIRNHFIDDDRDSSESLSVSSQHYVFAVDAMRTVQARSKKDQYYYKLLIGHLPEVINHVVNRDTELGIIFISENSKKTVSRMIEDNNLCFHPLINSRPYVFIHKDHPLAGKDILDFEELMPYPCIMYDLDADSPSVFNEELITNEGFHPEKCVIVNGLYQSLRAMEDNFAFDVGTGCLSRSNELYGVVRIPVRGFDMPIDIGYVTINGRKLSQPAEEYIECIRNIWAESESSAH